MTELMTLVRDAAQVAPSIFASDFLRYAIGAGGVYLLVNGLFSGVLKGRRIRPRNVRRGQLRRELLTSLRTIVIFAGLGLTIWTGTELGLLRFYEDPAALGWTWFVISVVLLIVLHDAWFYWTHRLIHDPRLFRRFHLTHHKSVVPTPFTSYAFDTREALINGIFLPIIGALMPISYLAMFIFMAHMMLRNAIGHCGYELFPRNGESRPLFDWMTTVTHHDLHHAEARWNYGLYFTFWDRLMGTEHPEYQECFAEAVNLEPKAQSHAFSETMILVPVSAIIMATVIWTLTPIAQAEEAAPGQVMEAIAGNWATQGYGAVVQMEACRGAADELCGRLVWAWDPSQMRPGAVGELMLTRARFENGVWTGGKLRNPTDGRLYSGKIIQTSPNTLRLKGCAFVFCQTQIWHRLESLPHLTGLSDRS